VSSSVAAFISDSLVFIQERFWPVKMIAFLLFFEEVECYLAVFVCASMLNPFKWFSLAADCSSGACVFVFNLKKTKKKENKSYCF